MTETTVPRALSTTEVEAMIEEFARSARLLQQYGFSGVEISAGHGHLFHQFLAEYSNERSDRFGGDLQARALVLTELLAQTGGLAAATSSDEPIAMRVAGFGPFKFPAAAEPGMLLEATARVVGRMGPLVKVEGEVTADGRSVAVGSVTLAEVAPRPPRA